ncbi:unnamed protein product [Urochloa humidicola]
MKPRMEAADDLDDDGDDLVVIGVSAMTVEDIDALDCGVCYPPPPPLKPPIFQCINGHAVCSPCRDKLKHTGKGKCHVCRIPLGSYNIRCHAMERLVDSIRVPCPHAAHGCAARVAYYDRGSHGEACPHAARGCPSKGCGFVGSAGALLDHVAGAHIDGKATRRLWTVEVDRLIAKLQRSVAADEHEVDACHVESVVMQTAASVDEAAKALKKSGGDTATATWRLRLATHDDLTAIS